MQETSMHALNNMDQQSSFSGAPIEDLKGAIHDTSLIQPSQQTSETMSIFLSNMDSTFEFFNLQTLHFFSPNRNFPPQVISSRLRTALQRLVDKPEYDLLAGRISMNHETGRMEVNCNGAGVGFAVAASELSLANIEDLVSPNNMPVVQLLLPAVESFDDDPPLVFQEWVTSFTCYIDVFDIKPEYTDIRTFKLNPDHIAFLKEKAKAEETIPSEKITRFNVVTAHVWRCRVLCKDVVEGDDLESKLLYAVNMGPRMEPPLPDSFSGNAVLFTYTSARGSELESGPFCRVVVMLWENQRKLTNEHTRSFVDWVGIHKDFKFVGDVLITSWWRLGFEKVEYPWGRPWYCFPLATGSIPDPHGGSGVNVCIGLPHKEMKRFQSLFRGFLQQP